MRDYKGSGGFTLRKRRRSPRGLLILTLLIIVIAVAGFLLVGQLPGINTPASTKAPTTAKPSSGRDVIPLAIPGQTPQEDRQQGG